MPTLSLLNVLHEKTTQNPQQTEETHHFYHCPGKQGKYRIALESIRFLPEIYQYVFFHFYTVYIYIVDIYVKVTMKKKTIPCSPFFRHP